MYTLRDAQRDKYNATGWKDHAASEAGYAAKAEAAKVQDLLLYFSEIGVLNGAKGPRYYVYPVNGQYIERKSIYDLVDYLLSTIH